MALDISGGSGPEFPMQVVQPYPTRLNPSLSRSFCRPDFDRYSPTTWEPRKRRLDPRLHGEPLGHRIAGEETGPDHHGRIRRIGAGRNGGDHHISVAEI